MARVRGVCSAGTYFRRRSDSYACRRWCCIPSAILAETTLSYAGLGFGADHPSWGTLLQEASDIRAMADYPWLLSAAGAIILVVLAVNLLLEHQRRPLVLSAVGEARATRP